MILLLLGTNPYPFYRLFNAVDKWSRKTGRNVIAQIGHTSVKDSFVECHDFVSHEQITSWIEEAEFVISQGGFGSLKDCITHEKNVIAVPRLQQLDECQDDQVELVQALENEGLIIPLYDVDRLEDAITLAESQSMRTVRKSAIPELVSNIVQDIIDA